MSIYDMSMTMEEFNEKSIKCFCNGSNHCSVCENKRYIIPCQDRSVCIIGAMAKNRVIGKDNSLPWNIPADLQYFKKMTTGKPVIMGRKTYQSIGRPLPNRRNIVLTSKLSNIPKITIQNNIESAILSCHPKEQIMVIGGAQVYSAALPYVNTIHLTIIDQDYDGDVCFPEFNNNEWAPVEEVMHIDNDPWFSFNTFKRIK